MTASQLIDSPFQEYRTENRDGDGFLFALALDTDSFSAVLAVPEATSLSLLAITLPLLTLRRRHHW